jgi:hypothetical protein
VAAVPNHGSAVLPVPDGYAFGKRSLLLLLLPPFLVLLAVAQAPRREQQVAKSCPQQST